MVDFSSVSFWFVTKKALPVFGSSFHDFFFIVFDGCRQAGETTNTHDRKKKCVGMYSW